MALDSKYTIDTNNVWNRSFKKFLDRFVCPCCNYPTLSSRNSYEICGLCSWEDDGQDDDDADKVLGGPNKDYSLAEVRENFRKYLTMYRPTDKIAFSRHDEKRTREIKDVYDKILISETTDKDHINRQLRLANRLENRLVKDQLKQ